MKKQLFLLLTLLTLKTNAQEVVTFCEQMPTFGKKKNALENFLQETLNYPEDAYQKGIQGKVIVNFIVNEDGSLSDIHVLKKVYPSIDDEAIRVIHLMPKWNPGKQNQKPVKVNYILPITFNLYIHSIPITYEWINPPEQITNEIRPSFPGGQDSLNTFVWNVLTYPPSGKENNIETKVIVTFQVDSMGNISNIQVSKNGWGFTEEALRIINQMPKWVPGALNQKPNAALVSFPIVFKLNGAKK
jgi:TonB family protein